MMGINCEHGKITNDQNNTSGFWLKLLPYERIQEVLPLVAMNTKAAPGCTQVSDVSMVPHPPPPPPQLSAEHKSRN